jgi:hypothetical protein
MVSRRKAGLLEEGVRGRIDGRESHAELDRRIRSLEEVMASWQERVTRVEARHT